MPKRAIAITQVLAICLLVLLCHNIKYRRFTPFRFSIVFALIYAAVLFVTVYLSASVGDSESIAFVITIIFFLVFCAIYFIDIFSICFTNRLQIVVVSVVVSLLLGILDILLLPNAWPVNNIIGVLVAGAVIKFVVIKKLKDAVFPLVFLWLFFIFRQILIWTHFYTFTQAL
ncbi:MAG: hypothetical protein KDD45_06370 [Bdellovibrionales bacterium]|nr:hypothetical protein [Bdellovibrionales bacterium]